MCVYVCVCVHVCVCLAYHLYHHYVVVICMYMYTCYVTQPSWHSHAAQEQVHLLPPRPVALPTPPPGAYICVHTPVLCSLCDSVDDERLLCTLSYVQPQALVYSSLIVLVVMVPSPSQRMCLIVSTQGAY